ncbi:MAG: hypothetical protein FJ304_20560 [Planctomycetes bacterium]|nr:hypothetical protein [Planctomycetota bacterium]
MIRSLAFVGALAVAALLVGAADVSAQPKTQMVKGTVKSADSKELVLVINQKLKSETVDRQLSITATTEFSVTDADGKVTNTTGKAGLALLTVGADVQVKCDKDVNVLKVTAKLKK